MSFFTKDALKDAKAALDSKGRSWEFFGEGRYHAKLLDVAIKPSTVVTKLGTPELWCNLEITEVLEGTEHKKGDKVVIFSKGMHLPAEALNLFRGVTKGVLEEDDLTADLANQFVDENNHDFDGQEFRFDRIRETYDKDGVEKSYIPLGLTGPIQ